jgi:hypothetical protein
VRRRRPLHLSQSYALTALRARHWSSGGRGTEYVEGLDFNVLVALAHSEAAFGRVKEQVHAQPCSPLSLRLRHSWATLALQAGVPIPRSSASAWATARSPSRSTPTATSPRRGKQTRPRWWPLSSPGSNSGSKRGCGRIPGGLTCIFLVSEGGPHRFSPEAGAGRGRRPNALDPLRPRHIGTRARLPQTIMGSNARRGGSALAQLGTLQTMVS